MTSKSSSAEHTVGVDETEPTKDAESEGDDIEATVGAEIADVVEIAVDLSSALFPKVLALGRGLPAPSSALGPSASGAGYPWHCGCRGPSPLPEAWVV